MLFSEVFKVSNPKKESWFDPILDTDTKLFIDPMLVFQEEVEGFEGCKDKIRGFISEAFRRVALAKSKSGKERLHALEMLKFKEPWETKLGYTAYGSSGSGMGDEFSRRVFDAVIDFIDLGLDEFGSYLSTFHMFVDGIGPDRISDMVTNIIKEELIDYTIKICRDKSIPTKKVLIGNVGFSLNFGWARKKVELPINPYDGKAIILVPKDFLRANSYLEIADFEQYIFSIDNESLRSQVTRLFTAGLSVSSLRKAVEKDRQIVRELLKRYIEAKQKDKAKPYDYSHDPDLIYSFREDLEKLVRNLQKLDLSVETKEDFVRFVESVITQFKKCIEKKEAYTLLFEDNDKPRKERASQILFLSIADTLCKEKDVDITPESKTGRGPVDFKMSKGYNKKIHVEIKLARNSKLIPGLEKQLPAYMDADDIDIGYYIVLKQIPGDGVRIASLEEEYKKLKLKDGRSIKVVVVDASLESRDSASKI